MPERANDCDTTLAFAAESRRERGAEREGGGGGKPTLSGSTVPAGRPAATRGEDCRGVALPGCSRLVEFTNSVYLVVQTRIRACESREKERKLGRKGRERERDGL